MYGQHDANWLAFYEYFRQICGLEEQTEKLRGLTEMSKYAGWALPHRGICWVSERHSLLARNERGRLHSLAGPAVVYPDGWKIYAVHGVRVPEFVIERPESITCKCIDDESNVEIRRVMIEQYRVDRYLHDSGAKQVHESVRGKLWRREFSDDEPIQMVEVVNSTPEPDGHCKTYFLRVPPDVRTADEAVAWTFGRNAGDYMPSVEA